MPFLKKEENQELPCAHGEPIMAGPLVSTFCPDVPQILPAGVEPVSIWSGGSTLLGKQPHSSAVILHPCPWSSNEVFVKEAR